MTSIPSGWHCTAQHNDFSWRQFALLPLAASLLTACGGGGSTASNTADSLSASVALAHAALSTRPESMVFRGINSAGTKCAALPQDVTLTLGTPTKGKFIVFDDAHDGKELCYTSFKEGAAETVAIGVKNPDGTDFPGGGSAVMLDVSDTYNTSPDLPQTRPNRPPVANAGADQSPNEGSPVNLSGSGTDPDGDSLTYSWARTDNSSVTATLSGATTATPSFTAPLVNADTTLTFTLTVSDGHGGTATDAVNMVVKNNPVVQPTPTGKLNDTGITTAQCGNASGIAACSQAGFPSQDAENGRDYTQATNNDADGHRGFSFTKISSTGQELPVSATQWSCVKDNVTGLIWEVKTDDNRLHDKDWIYTWYDTNTATNGGDNGTADGGSCGGTSICDTSRYVAAVNTAGWCGASSGWRMPTVTELQSIVDLSRNSPAIDTTYFPNTVSTWYWSGTPYADITGFTPYAWTVYFDDGDGQRYDRFNGVPVRLVRSGQ